MSHPPTLVIIGAGLGASQLCASLAEAQATWRIVLIGEEPHLPYHRPPLSKTLIKDPAAGLQALRGAVFYEQAGIELKLGWRALALDPVAQTVTSQPVAGGAPHTLAYDHLVLATGATARALPGVPVGTAGVHLLRDYDHAVALRAELAHSQHLVVVGGGFIGLEAAATARAMGRQVTVLESAERLLPRAASPALSAQLLAMHREAGIDIRLGTQLDHVLIEHGRFAGVQVAGHTLAADTLLVGIGAQPNTALAQAAGLPCDNGITVDAQMRSANTHISAVGDCCNFPRAGARLRLESVQNAQDQARVVAARLLGQPQDYQAVPWFWSDQGPARLQMTGLWRPGLFAIARPGKQPGAMSWLHFEGDTLVAIESINSPADQMNARKLMQAGKSPSRANVADPAQPLVAA